MRLEVREIDFKSSNLANSKDNVEWTLQNVHVCVFTVFEHVHRVSSEQRVRSIRVDDRPEVQVRYWSVGQVELSLLDVVRFHRVHDFQQFRWRLFAKALQKVATIELMLAAAHLDRQHLRLVAREMVECERREYAASRQNHTMEETWPCKRASEHRRQVNSVQD